MTDLYPICVTRNYVTRGLAPSRLQKYLWHLAASRILQLGHGAYRSSVRSPVSIFSKCPDRPHSIPSIILFFLWRYNPTRVMTSSFLRILDHTQRRSTVGRTPLDEWSARRRDLYLTTYNTHNRQISMPPMGCEPTISAGEGPQTCVLDRAATGTGTPSNIFSSNRGEKQSGCDAEHSHLLPRLRMSGALPPLTTYAILPLHAQNTNCRGHSHLRNLIFLHVIQNLPAVWNLNCVRKHNIQYSFL